jgi:ubiquinone/menaquinone biosynthesis C-methylase UbiE
LTKPSGTQKQLIQIYRKQAKNYDASGIAGLDRWRKEAVRTLNLKRGDIVVDIGCGTGLNFPFLQEAVGPEGRIIGVDLTDAMLELAQERVSNYGWKNVVLVQSDAAQYIFPNQVNGIISVFALSFIPENTLVIEHGAKALTLGGKWLVLDMAWPEGWPLWLSRSLFFLSSWGITSDLVQHRPWKRVLQAMQQHLVDVEVKRFGLGFFYIASGTKP